MPKSSYTIHNICHLVPFQITIISKRWNAASQDESYTIHERTDPASLWRAHSVFTRIYKKTTILPKQMFGLLDRFNCWKCGSGKQEAACLSLFLNRRRAYRAIKASSDNMPASLAHRETEKERGWRFRGGEKEASGRVGRKARRVSVMCWVFCFICVVYVHIPSTPALNPKVEFSSFSQLSIYLSIPLCIPRWLSPSHSFTPLHYSCFGCNLISHNTQPADNTHSLFAHKPKIIHVTVTRPVSQLYTR